MQAGGYQTLGGQLFANTPDAEFQVTARRRKSKTLTVSVPASPGTATLTVLLPIDAPDILQPNDAYLVDLLQASFLATAPGITVQVLTAFLQTVTGSIFPLGTPVQTLATVPSALGVFANSALTPTPNLLTSLDIGFVTQGQLGPLTPANQPLSFALFAQFANSTAGAINASVFALAFYRLVRGLQEG